MKVQIQVTQDDISRGIRSSVHACPVALAMARVLGHRFGGLSMSIAQVAGGINMVMAKVDNFYIYIPLYASVLVEEFDDGCQIPPFEFTLTIPDPEPVEDHP